MQLVLRELQSTDEVAFKCAVEEFARTDPDWPFAFDFDLQGDFRRYVDRLRQQRRGLELPDGWVPNTFLAAMVDDAVVGRVSLRHELNDFLREVGGHVGYGVVASHRRRGYATEMLRQTLPVARAIGLERLLVTCDEDNPGSIRTIERNGGVLEAGERAQSAQTRKLRYWIDLREEH